MLIQMTPTSIDELSPWARDRGVPLDTARKRFVGYLCLRALASNNSLRSQFVFKGGNALVFTSAVTRSTLDLDFTATAGQPFPTVAQVRHMLDGALRATSLECGIRLRVQSAERKPDSPHASTPTDTFKVAYAFPHDREYARWDSNRCISQVIPMEISWNDWVSESQELHLPGLPNTLTICTLNDIVAEKLRALLQQVVRDRRRPQDVLDLATIQRQAIGRLNLSVVRKALEEKCRAREIVPSRRLFLDPRVRRLAEEQYKTVLTQCPPANRIGFEDAFTCVLSLVEVLGLPNDGPDFPRKPRLPKDKPESRATS